MDEKKKAKYQHRKFEVPRLSEEEPSRVDRLRLVLEQALIEQGTPAGSRVSLRRLAQAMLNNLRQYARGADMDRVLEFVDDSRQSKLQAYANVCEDVFCTLLNGDYLEGSLRRKGGWNDNEGT